MKTFGEKVIELNQSLDFTGKLPAGVRIMNPFKDDEQVMDISSRFYRKYYDDTNPRHIILGINPGRFGAAVTGVPFTDTKRLLSECDIAIDVKPTHEPSASFVYDVIHAYGGVRQFYANFYINSICPLGFTIRNNKGRDVNYNYYDSAELTAAVQDFIIESIQKQIALDVHTDVCFCMGTGKNEKFLRKLNEEHRFFDKIIAFEHPRFVMQYKAKSKEEYVQKYLDAFATVLPPKPPSPAG